MIERTYLGDGCVHVFRNNVTDELVYVKVSQGEYDKLAGVGGAALNPTLEGHMWVSSRAGVPLVDSPKGVLQDGEFVVTPTETFAITQGKPTSLTAEELNTLQNGDSI